MKLIPREELEKPSAAKEIATLVLDHLEAEYARRLECRKLVWNLVWKNSLAPHNEIISEMGTLAGRVFEASIEDARSLKTLAAIWGHDPETAIDAELVEAPFTYLPQADGSLVYQPDEPVIGL